MNMKHILSAVAFFATIHASAQQVNPVPDYVFRNQMSVGRNAVTDTAAYFSIGPRYGATKGFMPPIVGDTATFSSGKRNGLLIFSVQKNKFLYWDSVRVQWSDMAGSSGAYIVAGDTSAMLAPYLRKADTTSMLTAYLRKADTSSMLTNYIRHAGYGLSKSGQAFLVDTAAMATRARVQKGIDSIGGLLSGGTIGGSGTTNYVPKFTASTTLGNSQIFDNGTNVGINATSMSAPLSVFNSTANTPVVEIRGGGGSSQSRLSFTYGTTSATTAENGQIFSNTTELGFRGGSNRALTFYTNPSTETERLRIFANGRVGVNTTTDAGYQFDVNGSIRNTTGAAFATSSGSVGIGTASPSRTLHIYRAGVTTELYLESDAGTQAAYYLKNTINALYMPAGRTGQMRFFVNAADRVTFDSTGFVGIGTTTPTYNLDINGTLRSVNGANFATTSGNVGIGTASPVGDGTALNIYGSSFATIKLQNSTSGATATDGTDILVASSDLLVKNRESGSIIAYTANTERGRINSAGEWIIDASGTDAGDYKLQVVGNARVGTGKLDIASNTTFGIGVARSGTSEVAGQIYNSNGILYLGAESSAGGQIFSGSTAYAAVIGSGANYPLQFAVNNAVKASIDTYGALLINTTTGVGDYKLQVNGGIKSNDIIFSSGTNASIVASSMVNKEALAAENQSITGSNDNSAIYITSTWNTTGSPSALKINVTNTASGANANLIEASDGGTNTFRVTKDAGVFTSAPTGGTARKWKLGSAASVSPTSPNRTIQIEVDGTVYYLHAKTTND